MRPCSDLVRPSLLVLIVPAALLAGATDAAEDAGERFAPGTAGAEQYGPNPGLACPRSVDADVLSYDLKKLSDKAKKPEAKLDGRLCAMAQSLLAWDPAQGDSPPAPVIAFLSSHFGLAVPARFANIWPLQLGETGDEKKSSTTEEAKAISERLRNALGQTLNGLQQPRWGIATQHGKKGAVKVAVVMDDRILELDPVPRKLAAGQTVPLSGKVLPPYQNPKIAVSDERGQITRPDATPGDAFKGELKCGSTPGDLWVEVQAERDGKTATIATISFPCGKDLATSVVLSSPAWPQDTGGQERRLADGVNAQREAVGLPRLDWDDKLADVARKAAETVRDQLARGEAPAVDLASLLEKGGVSSALVLQNPAQTRSAEEAEQRFTASPTNRQNVLNPEVNRVGVGMKRELYAAVEKRRGEAGATPAKVDPKLEKVAQQYADALAQAGGKLAEGDADDITHGIRIAYTKIDMIEGAKSNPMDFAADQTVVSPGTSVGLGVAQGDHPVLGKNAVYVTFIVATPRVAENKPAAKPKPAPKKK